MPRRQRDHIVHRFTGQPIYKSGRFAGAAASRTQRLQAFGRHGYGVEADWRPSRVALVGGGARQVIKTRRCVWCALAESEEERGERLVQTCAVGPSGSLVAFTVLAYGVQKFVMQSGIVPEDKNRATLTVDIPQAHRKGTAALMVFQDGQNYINLKGNFRAPTVFDNLIARGEMPF